MVFENGIWLHDLHTYRHKYDSTITTYTALTKLFEIELPVILNYELSPNIGISAGVSFTKGKLIYITEDLQHFNGLEQVDTFQIRFNTPVGTPPDTSQSFHHTTPPFSTFVPGKYSEAGLNPLRIGYMLGINYNRRRWLVELTMNQQLSGLSSVTDDKIKRLYSQPYFRILLGLRL
jgi:hypothetical protein